MTKQTTGRLPDGRLASGDLRDDGAADVDAVESDRGDSVSEPIIDSLGAEIERVRADDEFAARAKKLLERDRSILNRLAK